MKRDESFECTYIPKSELFGDVEYLKFKLKEQAEKKGYSLFSCEGSSNFQIERERDMFDRLSLRQTFTGRIHTDDKGIKIVGVFSLNSESKFTRCFVFVLLSILVVALISAIFHPAEKFQQLGIYFIPFLFLYSSSMLIAYMVAETRAARRENKKIKDVIVAACSETGQCVIGPAKDTQAP